MDKIRRIIAVSFREKYTLDLLMQGPRMLGSRQMKVWLEIPEPVRLESWVRGGRSRR